MNSRSKLVLSLVVSACVAHQAAAQPAFPTKPVQMVVPYTAGGGADVVMRAVSQRLAEAWGKNVVVDNRAGASGMIGTEYVAKAEPDGYVLLGHTSSYPATAAIREKLPFDPARSIVPVASVAKTPLVLVVHPSLPAKSVKELVALAKARPGSINYGSSGIGSSAHMSSELFRLVTGAEMTHIPYKGVGPATNDLIAGQIPLMFNNLAVSTPFVKNGRLRALAVTGSEGLTTSMLR